LWNSFLKLHFRQFWRMPSKYSTKQCVCAHYCAHTNKRNLVQKIFRPYTTLFPKHLWDITIFVLGYFILPHPVVYISTILSCLSVLPRVFGIFFTLFGQKHGRWPSLKRWSRTMRRVIVSMQRAASPAVDYLPRERERERDRETEWIVTLWGSGFDVDATVFSF